jgi:hypothetical protein
MRAQFALAMTAPRSVKMPDASSKQESPMSRFALAISLAFVCTIGGCNSDTTMNSPVDQQQYEEIRAEYQRHNPDARVGLVTAVLPDEHLASVGSVPVKDFSLGDIVSFIDADGDIIATGQVEAISNNRLNVRYTPPSEGRNPIRGDLAVRAIK